MSELEQTYFLATGEIKPEKEIIEELHDVLLADTGAPVRYARMPPAAAQRAYAATREVRQ